MKMSVVVLHLAKPSIPEKIAKCRFIVTSMTGNSNFPNPTPALADVSANVNALETAAIAADGGGSDETANMYAKELMLDRSLKSLAAYVEGIANNDPVNADAMVLSAGMDVKTPVLHTAREFNVSVTTNPGEVRLATKFVKHATFMFQMSTEPNTENSWQTIMQSTRSKFVKSGLTSGTRYYFRVAVIDTNGQSPWSNVLNSVVL